MTDLSLLPDSEIDELVATEVMGWHYATEDSGKDYYSPDRYFTPSQWFWEAGLNVRHKGDWHPTGSHDDAFEALHYKFKVYEIEANLGYIVTVWNGSVIQTRSDLSLPRAISEACILAIRSQKGSNNE